jgi:hypothetical protein
MLQRIETVRQDIIGSYKVSTVALITKGEREIVLETMIFRVRPTNKFHCWDSIRDFGQTTDAKTAALTHKLALYDVWSKVGWLDKAVWYIKHFFEP